MAHTLVTFHADPDDESLLTAGVMAKAAADGHRVVLVVATAGEVGDAAATSARGTDGPTSVPPAAASWRGQARSSACTASPPRLPRLRLGPESTAPEPRRDGGRPSLRRGPVDEAAEGLAAVLREEDADVLTVYDPNGGYGHPDHVHVHAVGHRAAELAGTPVVLEATINRDLMTVGVELRHSLGSRSPTTFSTRDVRSVVLPAAS